jgi:hypothetical protein
VEVLAHSATSSGGRLLKIAARWFADPTKSVEDVPFAFRPDHAFWKLRTVLRVWCPPV